MPNVVKTLYADTYVWNQLQSQNVDPRTFCTTLGHVRAVPVLGFQDVYELAKTFRSGNKDDRAKELFDYVRGYLAIRVPIVYDTGELLKTEARKAAGEIAARSFLVVGEDYDEIILQVDKLRCGIFETDVADFIEKRLDKAERSRSGIEKKLAAQPDFVAMLKPVQRDTLPAFLKSQLTDFRAAAVLGSHLSGLFPRNSAEEIARAAILLRDCDRFKISRALIRAHFYLRWRVVMHGSIRDDLFDDVFHVVNAAYCDYFATTEDRQADYARLIIPDVTVILADRTEQILDRLAVEIVLNNRQVVLAENFR